MVVKGPTGRPRLQEVESITLTSTARLREPLTATFDGVQCVAVQVERVLHEKTTYNRPITDQ